MRLLRNNTGDTIVEVLIAMAVIAAVLGASYTVVNRTMANARQAQEHTEALQVANEQIEFITTLATQVDTTALRAAGYKCVNPATGAVVPQARVANPYDAKDRYETPCVGAGSVPYMTAFNYNTASNLYTVYVTWPAVTGVGYDQVRLVYKAFQP